MLDIKALGSNGWELIKTSAVGAAKNGSLTAAGGAGLQAAGWVAAGPWTPFFYAGVAGGALLYPSTHAAVALGAKSKTAPAVNHVSGAPTGSTLDSWWGTILSGVAASALGAWVMTKSSLTVASLPVLPAVYGALAGYVLWIGLTALIGYFSGATTTANAPGNGTPPPPPTTTSEPAGTVPATS